MRDYTVYVYNYIRRSGKNRPLAYTRYQGSGACVHKVKAATRAKAIQGAVAEHLENPSCNQEDGMWECVRNPL